MWAETRIQRIGFVEERERLLHDRSCSPHAECPRVSAVAYRFLARSAFVGRLFLALCPCFVVVVVVVNNTTKQQQQQNNNNNDVVCPITCAHCRSSVLVLDRVLSFPSILLFPPPFHLFRSNDRDANSNSPNLQYASNDVIFEADLEPFQLYFHVCECIPSIRLLLFRAVLASL
jgi:hypothetical protein